MTLPQPDMVLLLLGSLLLLWHLSALAELRETKLPTGAKLRWALAIVLLLPFGLIAWWVKGRKRSRRYLGTSAYLSIAIVAVAILLGLTRELWQGFEHLAWIAAWSVVTFAMYLVDKLAARQGKDAKGSSKAARINELSLHLCALLGGFVGGWIARHGLRHKTRHPEFGVVLVLATLAHASKLAGLW